jgi:hypothetical protein
MQFFIGPEVPGYGATGAGGGKGTAVPPYKQSPGTLKRQAARFRIWRYTWDAGKKEYLPDAEDLDLTKVKSIKWTVELANRKASFFEFHGTNGEDPGATFNPRRRNRRITAGRAAKLEIIPGPRSIGGLLAGPVVFDLAVPEIPITFLGELHTDDKGRLIVAGGYGKSLQSAVLAAASGVPVPQPLRTYANNPTWFDDVSDGPVTAEIELNGGQKISSDEIDPAWVIVGPPDFAPALRSVVSLYDVMTDVWVRSKALDVSGKSGAPKWLRDMRNDWSDTSGFTNFRPDFVRDVYPILQAVINTRWVHMPAQSFHFHWDWAKLSDTSAAAAPERKRIFERIRRPPSLTGLPEPASSVMPRLMGDEEVNEHTAAPRDEDGNADPAAPRRAISAIGGPKSWLSVTAVQYAILRRWMLGQFDKPGWPASNKPEDLPAPPAAITPWGLDQAALEGCVGGAFFPGIEVGWLIRNWRLYETKSAQESVFRIVPWRHRLDGTVMKNAAKKPLLRTLRYGSMAAGVDLTIQAGYFTQQMALPWPADFLSCGRYVHEGIMAGWWPAQRPDDLFATTKALPLSAADLAAFDATVGMESWLGATAAAAGIPERRGTIATREKLLEHFEKLGFIRAADAVGDKRPNRGTVYVEQERDDIP